MEIEKLIEKITEEIYRKIKEEINDSSFKTVTSCGDNCVCDIHNVSYLAAIIDHTLLKQDATEEQIRKLCQEAKEYKFASVCVNTSYVPLAAELLRGSSVKVCCTVGFPLGASTTKAKVFETKEVIENGAQEVDMVINVGAVKSGDWDYVRNDIESVVIAAGGKALVKVIFETCLLNDEEKTRICSISKQAGADFVKTSTGFSTGGATVEDIRLMRKAVGQNMGVKASGGIKDYDTALAMVKAGATRLGTSSGVAIAKKEKESAAPNMKKGLY